jgi:acetyl-CoA carboxylase biotin carboxyl carrier protein
MKQKAMDEVGAPTRDTLALLEKAYGIATAMAVELPVPPSVMRIVVGDVVVDLEWAGPTAATGHRHPVPQTADGPAAQTPPAATVPPDRHPVLAPAVGVFYQAPQPGAPPFVRPGDVVQPGQRVAIVEAMKLMMPVESDWFGRVAEVLVQDGDPVEYGTPLMLLEPTDVA